MADRSVTHSTFTLERDYPASPDRVFAAWSERNEKAKWFASGGGEYALDFRVGGLETVAAQHNGAKIGWETLYREIVDDERIVYTSVMSMDGVTTTLSLTTVELAPTDAGTRLTLTEQGAYLDGHEKPEWREHGTGEQLDKLGSVLTRPVAAGR